MKNHNYKKKYGQNFLIDLNVKDKILNEINAKPGDLIIEIGAGNGVLTLDLVKTGAKVVAYEIDEDLRNVLKPLESDNLEIIMGDFLTSNIEEKIKKIKYKNLYIVGNLPYYITTPIIKKIINSKLCLTHMIFMVQKEVAERFSSIPKNKTYGYITVYLNYYLKIEKLFDVSNTSFKPIPKVTSSIIKLVPYNCLKSKNEQLFFQLIKDSFQFKRKTLLNNLKNYDAKIIKEVLAKNNIELNARAEELSLPVFVDISNSL